MHVTYPSGESIKRNLVLLPVGPDTLTDLPCVGTIDLSYRELLEAVAMHDNTSNLISTSYFIVDLLQDLTRWQIGRAVSGLELLLLGGGQVIVQLWG